VHSPGAVKEAPDGAEFEVLVLQHVRGCFHVPEYLGHCMVEDTLFLAMSFVEGIPIAYGPMGADCSGAGFYHLRA